MGRRRKPPARGQDPTLDRLTDATMRALDRPEGEAILDRMASKELAIPDGLAQLAVLSGDYEWKPGQAPDDAA